MEAPAAMLITGVLANEAIKSALQTSRQPEIGQVDCEHQGFVEDALVEPVEDNQFDAERPSAWIGGLLPFVDPGEAPPAPFGPLTDQRDDARRLQPVEGGAQPLIVARARGAAGEDEDF